MFITERTITSDKSTLLADTNDYVLYSYRQINVPLLTPGQTSLCGVSNCCHYYRWSLSPTLRPLPLPATFIDTVTETSSCYDNNTGDQIFEIGYENKLCLIHICNLDAPRQLMSSR